MKPPAPTQSFAEKPDTGAADVAGQDPGAPSRRRTTALLVHALAFAITLAFAKIICLIKVEADWADLPWLIGRDALVACFLAAVVWLNSRLARVLMDLLLVYYVINIHYAALFGGFIDSSALQFASEIHSLLDSMIAVADWAVLGSLPILMLMHRFLAYKLWPVLQSKSLGTQARLIAAGVLIAVALSGPFTSSDFDDLRRNPLGLLVSGVFERTASTDPWSTGSTANTALLFFDRTSRYPSPSNDPPVVNRQPLKRFNVVLVMLESTGNVSRRRAGEQTMPNFEALTQTGVYWPNFYAHMPLSIKSIFSVHSGHYPAGNFVKITDARPRFPCKALPEYFKEQGYRTALLHGGFFEYSEKRKFLIDRGYDVLHDGKSVPNAAKFERDSWGIDDKAIYDFAEGWIDASTDPFFVTLIPILPHHPYDTPKRWRRKFDGDAELDKYHNSLYFEDELLGNLIQHLKTVGRYEDTVFVVMGDHGEAFAQHRRNRVHSAEIYEENVNVPLVISNPLLFGSPQSAQRVASLEDILPTLCDLMGFDTSAFAGEGVSLFGESPAEMAFFYTALREPLLGLRDGNYKFIYRVTRDKTQLYDLSSDPRENRDLAAAHPHRVEYYKEKVLQWQSYSIRSISTFGTPHEGQEVIDLTTLPMIFRSQEYGSLRYNETISEKPFRIGGKTYDCRGFGTHANSILTFDVSLYQGYTFKARFGRDQAARGGRSQRGKVRAQIWLDGKVAYESPLLGSRNPPVSISQVVAGRRLSLVVLETDDGRYGDHVDWLEPRLVAEASRPVASPTQDDE